MKYGVQILPIYIWRMEPHAITITYRSWRYFATPKSFGNVRYTANRNACQIHLGESFFHTATTHHSERRQQTMSEKIVQLHEEVIKGQLEELVHSKFCN